MFYLYAKQSDQPWDAQNLSYKVHSYDQHLQSQTQSSQSSYIILPSSNSSKPSSSSQVEFDVNCTIIYLAKCMSMHNCRINCGMMGASTFRWFHNACCQCIGPCELYPYGNDRAMCRQCTDVDMPEILKLEEHDENRLSETNVEGTNGDENNNNNNNNN